VTAVTVSFAASRLLFEWLSTFCCCHAATTSGQVGWLLIGLSPHSCISNVKKFKKLSITSSWQPPAAWLMLICNSTVTAIAVTGCCKLILFLDYFYFLHMLSYHVWCWTFLLSYSTFVPVLLVGCLHQLFYLNIYNIYLMNTIHCHHMGHSAVTAACCWHQSPLLDGCCILNNFFLVATCCHCNGTMILALQNCVYTACLLAVVPASWLLLFS